MDAVVRTELLERLKRNSRELMRRRARTNVLDFGSYVFPDVEKGDDYERTWFNEVLNKEVMDFIRNDDPDCPFLMVWAPPRHGKSQFISRFLPAFLFGKDPNTRIIGASYGQDFANKISRDVQQIMLSRRYAEIFPSTRLPRAGLQADVERRSTTEFDIMGKRGSYVARGVGTGATGRGADWIIIDDPIKNRADAESQNNRDSVWQWYRSSIRTRLEKGGKILLILTRWHEDDLGGRLLKKMKTDREADKWKVVSLPALAEKSPNTHPKDKRKPGEPLWPERYSKFYLLKTKATLGPYDWSALYQQSPLPPGGAAIKRQWLMQIISREKTPEGLQWVRFWDLAVTTKKRSDHTASVQAAMDIERNLFLRGGIRGKWTWPGARKILITAANREKVLVGVESTATQIGFVNDLQQDKDLKFAAIVGCNPTADKLTRALPWIAKAAAGKLYVVEGPWVDDFIEECVRFTGAGDAEDDQIDAVSGAYQMLLDATDSAIAEFEDDVY